MRARFSGYQESFFLCKRNHLYTVSCRTMAQMKLYTGFPRKENISGYISVFIARQINLGNGTNLRLRKVNILHLCGQYPSLFLTHQMLR